MGYQIMGVWKFCVGKNFTNTHGGRKLENCSLGGLLHHAAEGGPPNPPMQGRVITLSCVWLVFPLNG